MVKTLIGMIIGIVIGLASFYLCKVTGGVLMLQIIGGVK